MSGQPHPVEARSEAKLRTTAPLYAAVKAQSAHIAVEQAISATPAGPVRELLTSINLMLHTAQNALTVHDGQDDALHQVDRLNTMLSGEQPPDEPATAEDIDIRR